MMTATLRSRKGATLRRLLMHARTPLAQRPFSSKPLAEVRWTGPSSPTDNHRGFDRARPLPALVLPPGVPRRSRRGAVGNSARFAEPAAPLVEAAASAVGGADAVAAARPARGRRLSLR